ncbi:MAG: DUF6682 family protein [Burkholderiaceae bacterium]
MTARTIIEDAQRVLQDTDGIRWTVPELINYLNRAQREVQSTRPDTTSKIAEHTCVDGALQTIPADAAVLIDIPSLASGERITKTDLLMLDSVEPAWRKKTKTATLRHFMHDLRTPRQFQVYPPALAGTKVQMEFSAYPEDVPTASDVASIAPALSVQPQWENALLCLVLHYAFAKDAEVTASAGQSAAYLQRAQEILTGELQSSSAVAPKT